MNIALVLPKSTFLIDPLVYPPLGLWYLAAQLEALGHDTAFFDLSVDSLPEDGDFDQVWVSATSAQFHEVRRLGNIVKDWRQTSTVLGGPGVWARGKRDEAMEGFDLVVIGESDYPEAVNEILWHAIFGQRSTYTCNPPVTMDHILPPVRRWAHRYHATLEHNGVHHKTTTMFTSRGCPNACAFCESGRNGVIWGGKVRYEPMDVVRQQLDDIQAGHFTGVMFYDDILPLNKPRTSEICKELQSRGLVWRCFLRTDIIAKQGGYDYLKELRGAGLVEVLAGVESADNRIKKNIMKGTTIEQDTEALQWCQSLGIKFKASLILGLPGETRNSMEATRSWILKYKPDRVDVNILIPFPGTPITSKPELFDVYWTESLTDEFWFKGPRDDVAAIVGTSSLRPEEIKEFHDKLIKEIEDKIPY